jgi:hypothetical protein
MMAKRPEHARKIREDLEKTPKTAKPVLPICNTSSTSFFDMEANDDEDIFQKPNNQPEREAKDENY